MPSTWVGYVFLALVFLVTILVIAEAEVSRLRAGPVRFRLGLASRTDPSRDKTASAMLAAFSSIVLLMVTILMFIIDIKRGWPYLPLFLPLIMHILWRDTPRRDAKRWLVLATGLIDLASGAVFLAVVPGIISLESATFSPFPKAFWFVLGLFLIGLGFGAIREALSGTLVREGGIEMFAVTCPWSRVVVKDWQAGEGGFALRLSIRQRPAWRPRFRGARGEGGFALRLSISQGSIALTPGSEVSVPVPASERPALEEFLSSHAATATSSQVGVNVDGAPAAKIGRDWVVAGAFAGWILGWLISMGLLMVLTRQIRAHHWVLAIMFVVPQVLCLVLGAFAGDHVARRRATRGKDG